MGVPKGRSATVATMRRASARSLSSPIPLPDPPLAPVPAPPAYPSASATRSASSPRASPCTHAKACWVTRRHRRRGRRRGTASGMKHRTTARNALASPSPSSSSSSPPPVLVLSLSSVLPLALAPVSSPSVQGRAAVSEDRAAMARVDLATSPCTRDTASST